MQEQRRRHSTGKRVASPQGSGSASEQTMLLRTAGRVLFFPLLFIYLELVLHIYMKMDMKYFIIYFLFALAAGSLCSAVTMPFKRRVNRIIAKVLAVLISLIYVVELIAKKILQSYYPLSTIGLAAENHLTDYLDAIVSTVLHSIPIILVMLLPMIFLLVWGNRLLLFPRTDIRFAGVLAGAMVVFHLLALLMVHLPWGGDLTPKQLYKVDTNIEDQVEQLGLVTMLRLDIKHIFVPAGSLRVDDFDTPAASAAQPSGEPDTSADPDESSDVLESETPVIDTSPNVMDVDLEAVAESTNNENIQWLAKYFNSKTPTNKNEYTGMFEGYNVIFVTIEGFSGYAVDEELTPTLYKMIHQGFDFTNYYTPLHYTSTSGGECQNLLGLYPKDGNPISMKQTGISKTNCYFSLAQQLNRLGYTSLGYHANSNMYGRYDSHTNLGYVWKQEGTGLELECNSSGKAYWPQRDTYMIDASVDDYINGDDLFNIYYLTISGHMPYSWNYVAKQYQDLVADLPYSDTTKAYLATMIEADRMMAELIEKLDEAGKLENTLIVASADHVPYFNVDTLEELSGETFGSSEDLEALKEGSINVDVYHSSLIIWSASMEESVQVDKVCGQVDILPTVSNLLGLEYDSRMLSGSDILSDSEGQVIFHSGSWKTDKGYYNRYTQEFALADGVTMTEEEQEEYVSSMKKQVSNKLSCTELIIETDFYDYVFNQFQG